jgi:hypothetical protein
LLDNQIRSIEEDKTELSGLQLQAGVNSYGKKFTTYATQTNNQH